MRELVAQLVRASLWTLVVWGVAGTTPSCLVLVINNIYLVLYKFALFILYISSPELFYNGNEENISRNHNLVFLDEELRTE